MVRLLQNTKHMNDQIDREKNIHGSAWETMHGGYFSDPVIATPLVQKVRECAIKSEAKVIADLGGGVGSVLSILQHENINGVSLVNLDDSEIQLEAASYSGITCVRGSVDTFSRCDVGPDQSRILFMMRSVLHYSGHSGLQRTLRHLRRQIHPGEFFVHQTASFRHQHEADCLNELYRMMRTKKWYPTVDFLIQCLSAEGWMLVEMLPAVPLCLTSEDLMLRYHLSRNNIEEIREKISRNHIMANKVFQTRDHNFDAYLHYWIYVCAPVPGFNPETE